MQRRLYNKILCLLCVSSFALGGPYAHPAPYSRDTLAPHSAFESRREESIKKIRYNLLERFLSDKKTAQSIFAQKRFPPLPYGLTKDFLTVLDIQPASGNMAQTRAILDGIPVTLYFFLDRNAVKAEPDIGIVTEADISRARATGFWIAKTAPAVPMQQTLTEPELRTIEAPLSRIPAEEVKNILVYGLVDRIRFDPKLGEEIIMLWPLVSALHARYPHANIYVASQFPDVFFARHFGPKVIPVPRNMRDVKNWKYTRSNWDSFTLPEISEPRKAGARAAFIEDRKIDMVFSLSLARNRFVPREELLARNAAPPHIFALDPITLYSSALGPQMTGKPKPALYQDRGGTLYTVAGTEDIRRQAAPSDRLTEAGIWKWMIGAVRTLGLDVGENAPATLRLDISEAADALVLLRELFYKNNPAGVFDPTKKLIVVNVYAVTQGTLVTEDEWFELIATLVRNVGNAYFLFTHGGEMDADFMLIENIVEKVNKQVPGAENSMLVPQFNIYPHINHLLGIASGIITPDTGMSHLASGVYNIPAAVITTNSILHWMPPRENATPVIIMRHGELLRHYGYSPYSRNAVALLQGNFSFALGKIREFAEEIARAPERPEAVAAKIAGATYTERAELDQELLRHAVPQPHAEKDLLFFIKKTLDGLPMRDTLPRDLTPRIAFVDSAAQTGIGVPRFSAKIFTPRVDEPILLVDISSLETVTLPDGTEAQTVKEQTKKLDILHEIVGHLAARRLFQSFGMLHNPLIAHDDKTRRFLQTEEEVLSRIMHFIAAYLLYKNAGMSFDEGMVKKFQRLDAMTDFDWIIDLTIRYVAYLSRNECLSTYAHAEALRDPETAGKIKADLKQKYLLGIFEFFGVQGVPGLKDDPRRQFQPGPAEAAVGASA
jgi:hypothetical protein